MLSQSCWCFGGSLETQLMEPLLARRTRAVTQAEAAEGERTSDTEAERAEERARRPGQRETGRLSLLLSSSKEERRHQNAAAAERGEARVTAVRRAAPTERRHSAFGQWEAGFHGNSMEANGAQCFLLNGSRAPNFLPRLM